MYRVVPGVPVAIRIAFLAWLETPPAVVVKVQSPDVTLAVAYWAIESSTN
jgi:hypothetical protein